MRTNYLLLLMLLAFVGCTPQAELCSNTTTANDPACKVQSDLGLNAQLLEVKFTDSKFFDQNTKTWVVVGSKDFETGKVLATIPLYSNTIAKATADAVTSAASADAQFTSLVTTGQNDVPYIRVEAKPGVVYSYRYRKIDSLGVLKYEKLGVLPVNGSYAYIPLVNDFIDSQLYSVGTPVGTQFNNIFTITSTSGTKTGLAKQVQLTTTATVQNTQYLTQFGPSMSLMNLDNRWLFYKLAPSYSSINTNLDYLVLKDIALGGELTDLDVQIIFKDDFKVTIEQTLFEEIPFQLTNFVQTGIPVATRGWGFNTNTITLNSVDDFNHKLFLDTIPLTASSRKVYTVNAFPAGKRFDIKFNLDLTQSATYTGDPNTKGFQYPLQPVCKTDKGLGYAPWIDEVNRDALKAGIPTKFNAICHLDQSANITVDPANNPTNIALLDTWFNYFSYAPYRPSKNELGHLFGLSSLKFKVSACFKVQVKGVGTSTWTNRTQGNTNCGDAASTNDWLVVNTEKDFTIFDNLSAYDTVVGLRPLIETLRAAPLTVKPNMKINNEKLNGNIIRHLY